jgi:hypothetical protein
MFEKVKESGISEPDTLEILLNLQYAGELIRLENSNSYKLAS